MIQLRSLLLAGTVITGAGFIVHPAAVFAANDAPPVLAQAEQPPQGEAPPEEQKEGEKKEGEKKGKREERKQQRQEQKQQKQEQRQQKREERQQQKQEKKQEAPPAPKQEAPPPAEKQAPPPPPPVEKKQAPPPPPPAEKQAPKTDAPPPPPVEKKAAPPADAPPPPAEKQEQKTEQAPPAGTKQERREQRREERKQERQERKQEKQKGDVPPIPPIPQKGEQPPASPQPPADTPPPAGPGAQKSGDAPAPAPAPEAPSTAPAPPPAGEKPAVPPEELKGGAVTPEQRQRREERVEREFENRDRRFDKRFDRRIERRGDRTVIREGDNRVIIRDGGRVIIRSDETERFRRGARDVEVTRRGDHTVTVVRRPNGVEIVTVKDEDGNLIRRVKRVNGREVVLIDNRRAWERGGRWDRDRGWRHRDRDGLHIDFYLDLPPVVVGIPRDQYIIEADQGSYEEYEEAFDAPPLIETERPYSLQEVTQNVRLRERVRSVDLNTITFATAEWRVADDQVPLLEDIARAMLAVIEQNPNAVYLIEGHTDAVGSALDNLSLSDRRAEEVAAILTEHYQIPPENLVTQGYGEDYLRVNTEAANERNRRVTVRNITELLNVQQSEAQPQ